jgi:hypothetical protein
MLSYTKKVLKVVSFDQNLFCKEIKKAYNLLLPHELKKLTTWLLRFTESKPELRQCILHIV